MPRTAPRTVAWLGALLVLLIVGTACFVGRPGEESEPDTGAPPASGGSIAPDEFEADLEATAASAEEYWKAQFATAGIRFRPVREIIAYRRDREVRCGGQPLGRNNAAYCSAGHFIAYDVNWAAQAFNRLGDAFLFYLLGHEYAHGMQVNLGLQYRFTIEQELQADCMAGAYLGDSIRQRRLVLEEGDLEELRAGLIAVADDPDQPWFAEGAHGSAQQRTDAFFAGYGESLDACGLPTR